MNENEGKVISGKITDENNNDYFFQKDGVTYRLAKSEIKKPLKIGSNFKGFAYENEKHEMRITRNVPDVSMDSYAWGKVVSVKHDLGVFVDIGLPDKDIAVSLDDLPDMKSLWPAKGDELLIALKKDKKGRIWGELADDEVYDAISQPVKDPNLNNHEINAWVINPKKMGTQVITDHFNLGFIDASEADQQPRLGEKVKARVIGIRPSKSFYLTLKPRAMEVLGEDALMIQTVLKQKPTHFLPYNDKSSPKEIKDYFGISKAQFKRAVGRLLKRQQIELIDDGIKLKS